MLEKITVIESLDLKEIEDYKEVECLCFYDFCLISVMEDSKGELVIKYAIDFESTEENYIDRFMFFNTSKEDLEKLKSSEKYVYDFVDKNTNDVVLICDFSSKGNKLFKTYKKELIEKCFPEKNCYLNLELR